MNPAKRILAVLLCAALLIGVLCACGKTAGTGTDTNTAADDSIAQQLYDAKVTAPDLTNATEITLSGSDDVTITNGGVYVLTGTLTDGTASTLTDGDSYDYGDSFSSADDEEPNACLYSKSDLTIAGGGTLTVTMGGQSTDVTLESLVYGSGGMGGGIGGRPSGDMGTPPDRNGGKGTVPDNKSASLLPPR